MSILTFSQSLAIIIGIDQYENGISPLRTAVSDAKAVAETLEQYHGYDVVSYLNDQADLDSLFEVIDKKLPALLTPNSRLLIYFAGHGIAQNGDDGPTGYLVPQDASLGKVSSYLPMVAFHDALTRLPCRHLLAIFDCCFAGAFRWSSSRDISFSPKVIHQERFERFQKDPAWQVITSASYDQKAIDELQDHRGEVSRQHSPFAAAFLEALQGAADIFPAATDVKPAGDGVITATELYLYLRNRVEVSPETKRIRQTPGIFPLRKHDKGEYLFVTPGYELNLPPAPRLTKENNPYRGLESFDEVHSELFFGRDREIGQLIEKVDGPHPFTVVLGASGSGKSSLVKAGLLPQLKNREEFQILPVVRPGSNPLDSLVRACNSLMLRTPVGSQFKSDDRALIKLIHSWQKKQKGKKLLLVIDQAEELITQSIIEAEVIQFQNILKKALIECCECLRVIFTLRLDFEAQFQDEDLYSKWIDSRFVVSPMTQAQLRQAIEQPAAVRVLYFNPSSLVDELLEEVMQTPATLPLLSFTLSELYFRYLERRSEDRSLIESDYRAIGGVVGSLTKRAKQEYEKLVSIDSAYTQTTKHVLLRMVSMEGRELARRRVPLSELVYENKEKNKRVQILLERLTSARLIVQGKEGESYVEPAHDALVRGWYDLLRWKNEGQVSFALQRQLTPQVKTWQLEKDSGAEKQARGLLWNENPRLELLKEVINSKQSWLNRNEEKFVRHSLTLKRNRQLQFVVSIIVVVLGLSGLSFYALMTARNAKEQSIRSDSNATNAFLLANQPLKGRMSAVMAWQKVRTGSVSSSGEIPAWASLVQTSYYSKVSNLRYITKGADFKEKNVLEGHSSDVTRIVFSPDGNTFAAASDDNTITIWNNESGELINTIEGHYASILSIAFSADGRRIASTSLAETVQIWDVVSGELVSTIENDNGNFASVRFSPDNRVLAYAGNGVVKLRDIASGKLVDTFEGHKGGKNSLAYSPDGQVLAAAGSNNTINIWNISTGQLIKSLDGHSDWISSLTYSPDGNTIASASADRTVKLWNVTNGDLVRTFVDHRNIVNGVAYSPDGHMIASASFDKTVKLWNVDDGRLITTLEGHSDLVLDVAYTPDGQTLATASSDDTIKLWKIDDNDYNYRISNRDSVYDIAYSPDNKTLAFVSSDNTLKLWDISARKILKVFDVEDKTILDMAYSPDGRTITTAGFNESLKIWDATTGILLHLLEGHRNRVVSLAYSPNGATLASGGSDQTIKIWDATTGKLLNSFEGHNNSVESIAYSPDGATLASGSSDQTIKIWDATTGKLLNSFEGHNDAVGSVAYSPDSRTLASASNDQTVKMWDVISGELIYTLEGHGDWVTGVAFSPIGGVLASSSGDQTIKLWNVFNGELLSTLEGHRRSINALSYSPNGFKLASASDDETINIWTLDPELLVQDNCKWLKEYLTYNQEGKRAAAEGVCEDYL